MKRRSGAIGPSVAVLLALALLVSMSSGAFAKTKLRYFTWATNASILQEDFIQPFEKLHPDIEIEYEAVGGLTQFYDKLLTYCLAGNPPDLVHMSVGYLYEYAQKGLLVNLEPYFKRDLNPKDFFMEPMMAVRYPSPDRGDLYAVPFAFVLTTAYYNKTMFDNMGVGYPKSSWTYNEMRDMSRRLARDNNGDGQNDQWGFYAGYGYSLLDPIIHAFGGRILDDKFNVRVDEKEAVNAVSFLVDMIYKDRSAPPPTVKGSSTTLFAQGKLGMNIDLNANLDVFRDQASFDWDVALMPQGPAKRAIRLWPDSFAVMSGSKNVDAAWEYIKFVITQKKMDRYSGDRKIPVYRPLAMSREWLQEDQKPDKKVFIESVQYGDPMEFRPRWGDWTNARTATLGPVWRSEQPPEYGLKAWADAIRAALAAPLK